MSAPQAAPSSLLRGRAAAGVLLMAVLLQVGMAAYEAHQGHVLQRNMSLGGAAICLVFSLLLAVRPALTEHLNHLIVVFAATWLTVGIVIVTIQRIPLEPVVYMGQPIIAAIAFSNWPARHAWPVAAGSLALVAGAGLIIGGLNVTLLLFSLLLTALMGHLAMFGFRVHSEQVRAEVLRELALKDDLTGLANRRVALHHMAHLLQAPAHTVSAALLLDVDHFKHVNDTLGHEIGDRVLQRLARRMQEAVRAGDVVCRWGGEEFLILLTNLDPDQAPVVAERIRQQITHVDSLDLPRVTVSAGLSLFTEASDPKGIVALADQRLYAAKHAGRNTLVHAS